VVGDPKAEKGVKAISIPDIRWKRRDIKSIALLAQCMGKQKAAEAGAYEGWMHEDGFITEGTSSTSYIVAGGRIRHPAAVERRAAGRHAARHPAPCRGAQPGPGGTPVHPGGSLCGEEAFLTSASAIVLPVVDIDGRAIGSGKPGPIARRLRELYLEEARGGSA
jgi:D-alanine transaminase